MTFEDWFNKHWARPDKPRTIEVYRLCVASEVNHNVAYDALAGREVSKRNARKLAAVTGGEFTPESLCFPKTPEAA